MVVDWDKEFSDTFGPAVETQAGPSVDWDKEFSDTFGNTQSSAPEVQSSGVSSFSDAPTEKPIAQPFATNVPQTYFREAERYKVKPEVMQAMAEQNPALVKSDQRYAQEEVDTGKSSYESKFAPQEDEQKKINEWASLATSEAGRERMGIEETASMVPPAYRQHVLERAVEMAKKNPLYAPSDSSSVVKQYGSSINKAIGGISRGGFGAIRALSEPIADRAGVGLEPDQREFANQLREAIDQADPYNRRGNAAYGVAEGAPKIYAMTTGGAKLTTGLKAAGMKKGVATILGQGAAADLFFGQEGEKEQYAAMTDPNRKGGPIDPKIAGPAAFVGRLLTDAIFASIPQALGVSKESGGAFASTATEVAAKYFGHVAHGVGLMSGNAGKDAAIEEIASAVDNKSEGTMQAVKNILGKTWDTAISSAPEMALYAIPGTVKGTARPGSVMGDPSKLPASGPISRTQWKEAGFLAVDGKEQNTRNVVRDMYQNSLQSQGQQPPIEGEVNDGLQTETQGQTPIQSETQGGLQGREVLSFEDWMRTEEGQRSFEYERDSSGAEPTAERMQEIYQYRTRAPIRTGLPSETGEALRDPLPSEERAAAESQAETPTPAETPQSPETIIPGAVPPPSTPNKTKREEETPPELPSEPPVTYENPEITSVKNRIAEEIRVKQGRGLLPETVKGSFQQWLDDAAARLSADPELPNTLIERINRDPRQPMSEVDQTVLNIRYRQLANRLAEASDRQTAAFVAKDKSGHADATATVEMIRSQINELELANKLAGAASGKALASRKIELYQDFSQAALERRFKTAQEGKPLTGKAESYGEDAARLSKELQAAQAEVDKYQETKRQEQEAQYEIDLDKQLDSIHQENLKQSSLKRQETINERTRKLLKSAKEHGLDPDELEAKAKERAAIEAEESRVYNEAYRGLQKATGLTPKVISQFENRVTVERTGLDFKEKPTDILEFNGLDIHAAELARAYSVLGISDPQSIVDVLKKGPRSVPEWHDKIGEVAYEMGKTKLGDSWEPEVKQEDGGFPWEVDEVPKAEATGEYKSTLGKEPVAKKPTLKERRETQQKRITKAVSEFKLALSNWAKGTDPNAGIFPVEVINKGIEVIRAYASKSFTDFMRKFSVDAGNDTAEQSRPIFREAWKQAKADGEIPERDVVIEDNSDIGSLAKKLHREVVELGITDREQAVDAVHEELQQYLPEITRRQTKDAMSGYGDFKELPKDDISKKIREHKGELQQLSKIADLENSIKLAKGWLADGVSEAEVIKRLKAQEALPRKTGLEHRKPSDVERDYIKLVNDLKKQVPVDVKSSGGELRSSQDSLEARLKNQIADLDNAIKAEKPIVKGRKPIKHTAKIGKLIEERDAIKKIYEEMFPSRAKLAARDRAFDAGQLSEWDAEGGAGNIKPKRQLTDQERLDNFKQRKLEKLADLKTRLRNMDKTGEIPEKKPIRKVKLDKEAQNKQYAVDKLWDEVRAKEEEIRRANRNLAQKALGAIPDILNASRAILTSFDLSAVARQGGVLGAAHPKLAAKAMLPMLEAVWSEKGQWDAQQKIEKSDYYPIYKSSGLAITETGGKLASMEEAYVGNLFKNVPKWAESGKGMQSLVTSPIRFLDKGVRASERAYVTYLNVLRSSVFDSMAKNLESNGQKISIGDAKLIANWVNVATGRGPLGMFDKAAVPMATMFFSPRFVISRFQLLSGQPLWSGITKGEASWRARYLVGKEYGKVAGSAALFYSMVGLASALLYNRDDKDKPTISFDPRSSDWGKVKIGDTRIDPLAGLSQTIVFLNRMSPKSILGVTIPIPSLGESRDSEGKINELDAREWSFEGLRFARNKLSPWLGAAIDLRTGKNSIGETVTPVDVAQNMVIPLSMREVVNTMVEQGFTKGAAINFLSILGVGVQNYKKKSAPAKIRKTR